MSKLSLASLRDLARIVKRGIPERAQYLSRASLHDSGDVTSRFFQALAEGGEKSDSDLAKSIFGKSASDNVYKVHKSQIKQLLLNTLFVLDLDAVGYSEQTKRYRRNNKAAFLAPELLSMGADALAQSIAEAGLREAQEIEAWANAQQFAVILRNIAAYSGHEVERAKYVDEYFRIAEIERAEQQAMTSYEEIICAFTTTGGEKYKMAEVAGRALPGLEESYAKHPTFGLANSRFLLKAAVFQARQNYHDSLAVCEEYQALLAGRFKAFANADRLSEVAFKRLVCLLQIREYEKARDAAAHCAKLIPQGSNNWFRLREYEFLLEMHAERFEVARQILEETRRHERFELLPEHGRERWRIFEDHIDLAQGSLPEFRTEKELLKHLRIYSSDKSGFNASILILQILLLAERGKTNAISERIDALNKYRARHLKDEGNQQAHIFFDLLTLVGQNMHRIAATLREAEPLIQEFHAATGPALDGIQILPYNWLWNRLTIALHPPPPPPRKRKKRLKKTPRP